MQDQTDRQRLTQLEAAARDGAVDAIYELAQLLEYGGEGIPADLARAVALYTKAAEMGNGMAVYGANTYLLDPSSEFFNETKGIAILRSRMQTDQSNGVDYRRRLAAYLANATTETRDLAEAEKLLREGIALGDSFAIHDLAYLLEPRFDDDEKTNNLRDPFEAIKLYERYLALPEAQADYAAMAALANLYVGNEVENVDRNEKAKFWISKALSGESALANLYFGDFIFYGYAKQVYDFNKAKQYWIRASELDPEFYVADRIALADAALSEDVTTTTAEAMATLAYNYEVGNDRPVDPKKAQLWYERAIAADPSDRASMSILASLYDNEGSPSKAAILWRRLATGDDGTADDARRNLAAYEATRTASKPVVRVAQSKPIPKAPVATPAASKPAPTGKAGSPGARQIRDALVYEQSFGRVTVADGLGLMKRQADYEAGVSRAITFGISTDISFDIRNPRCTQAGQKKFSCSYDLKMVTAGFPYAGRGSHIFELRDGIWRSPTYLKGIIDAGNRSAAGATNGKNCTVQGFGTAEGASLRDQSGLPC